MVLLHLSIIGHRRIFAQKGEVMQRRWSAIGRTILIFGGLLALLSLGSATQSGKAADTLRIYDWAGPAPTRTEDAPVSGTGSVPLWQTEFLPLALHSTPARSDGRPIAFLTPLPTGVTEQALVAPSFIPNDNPNFIGYHLATVRYRYNGSDLYLATLQPANLGLQRPLDLGRSYQGLNNGRHLYHNAAVYREGPNLEIRRTFNQLSFVENGLVIVLASELPADQLLPFATMITLPTK